MSPHLTDDEVRVFTALYVMRGDDDQNSMSLRTIADIACVQQDQIIPTLDVFERRGWISIRYGAPKHFPLASGGCVPIEYRLRTYLFSESVLCEMHDRASRLFRWERRAG